MKKLPISVDTYADNYSQSKLFDKISSVAKKAGAKVIYTALVLYYALMSDSVNLRYKVMIIGSLGYFICPVDLIPDMLGPLGYSDDITVLLSAIKQLQGAINDEIKQKARTRLSQWFDEVEPSELQLA